LPLLLVLADESRDPPDDVLLLTTREACDILKELLHLAGWSHPLASPRRRDAITNQL
jgi:hypothetical protein